MADKQTSNSNSAESGTEKKLDSALSGPKPWSKAARWVVSLMVIFHLAAVISSPLSTPPSSGLSESITRNFRPYLLTLYLTHGYRFFAPEPGPSHIVRYEVIKSDGEIINGQFPDRDEFWPRQLYHRWFMFCLLYTSPSPRDRTRSRMPSSA